MRIMALFLLAAILLTTPVCYTYQECANNGMRCGVTLHTYWLKWDDTECGMVDGVEITEVPMYSKCTECGYSWYVGHVRVR